jgi:drug/metabolite transporter (DMT)-like permease
VSLGRSRAVRDLRVAWRPVLVLGALNAAVPFWLVAWGEKHVDSSVAGIAQATVPIFTFLLAWRFLPGEHVGRARIAGVALGFAGVALLAGLGPRGGWLAVAGTLAVVLSSLSYASAGVYGQLRVRTVSGPVLATGSMLVAGVMLLPLALVQIPDHAPSAEAIASLLALTILGTAFGQLVLFRVLRLYGSRRLSLVTYLMPGFALFYGTVFLDEPLTAAALAGLALILLGVALGSGQRLLGPSRPDEPLPEASRTR